MKESYTSDPLVYAAESIMFTEDVARIQKKVKQLEVGDKTNYGTVVEIGSDSITFKAPNTPKTEIAFKQRKMGSAAYLLMNLVKYTPDGKKLDKTFKEANDFTGAAAAAAVAGEDEFEFNGKTYPVEMDLEVAKKIMSQSLKLAKQLAKDMDEDTDFIESNEFVGAAAAAKVAGKDEFEFNGKTYPVEISQETAEKIMSQAIDLAKDLAKAKKEESTKIEEEVGSLKNSLKVLSKAGIRGRAITDMAKFAKAVHKNYKAITGEKYQDADQVAMSEIIADLMGHFRIDGDEFITAWDSTIREEKEITQYSETYHEGTEFVKGDAVMDVRTKLIGKVLHKGNKDDVFVKFGSITKGISGKNLRLVESGDLKEMTKAKLDKTNKISSDEYSKLRKKPYFNADEWKFSDKDMLYHRIVEEAEGEEWFTAEMKVKSSGQLYSTFYVQAKDMSQANKKAEKVFKELMKTSYPKDWPTYSKKFTLKVVKGDNMGELMP